MMSRGRNERRARPEFLDTATRRHRYHHHTISLLKEKTVGTTATAGLHSWRTGSWPLVAAALRRIDKSSQVTLAKDPNIPGGYKFDRYGWVAEYRARHLDPNTPPIIISFNVETGFMVSVPWHAGYAEIGSRTFNPWMYAMSDLDSYQHGFASALVAVENFLAMALRPNSQGPVSALPLLNQGPLALPILGRSADFFWGIDEGLRRWGKTGSDFLAVDPRTLRTTPIIDPLLKYTSGAVVDWEMRGLTDVDGDRFYRARIDFATDTIHVYLVEGTMAAFPPNIPATEHVIDGLERGMEIVQLGTVFRTASRLGSDNYEGHRVKMTGRMIANVNGKLVIQQEMQLKTMAGAQVDYHVDMPIPFIRQSGADGWKAKVLAKDGTSTYVDLGLGIDGLGLPLSTLRGYFDSLAAFHEAGKKAGGIFTPGTSTPDPHHDFTLQIPDASGKLAAAGAIARFHGCDFNPSVGGAGQFYVRVTSVEFLAGDVLRVVDTSGADSRATFNGITDMVGSVKAVGEMLVQAGGIRSRTSPATTHGVSIHGLKVGSGYIARLIMSATLGATRGRSGLLVDAATGTAIVGSDAADLRIILGSQPTAADFAADPHAMPAYPAELALRSVSQDERGELVWVQRDVDGGYRAGSLGTASSMNAVMEAIESAIDGAQIAVSFDVSTGIVDPLDVGLRLTIGDEHAPVLAFHKIVVGLGKPVPVGADILLNINSREMRVIAVCYYNTVGVVGGTSVQAVRGTIPLGAAVAVCAAIATFEVPGLLAQLEANQNEQTPVSNGYVVLATFHIGGVYVTRSVRVHLVQDPVTKAWSFSFIEINHPTTVTAATYTSIVNSFFHWEQATRGYPAQLVQEYGALVGEFVVVQATGQKAWLQFTNRNPDFNHDAVYGWLETAYFDPVHNRIGIAPNDPRRSDPTWMLARFVEFLAGCSPQANLNDPWGLPATFQYTTRSNPPAHPSWYPWS